MIICEVLMRRHLRFLFFALSFLGALAALAPMLMYKAPLCADVQRELGERVKAFVGMHLFNSAPQVEIVQSCGQPGIPDQIWLSYKKWAYDRQWTPAPPFSWQNLRMQPTLALLAHPDLGTSSWVIYIDMPIEKTLRLKLEEMLQRYLGVEAAQVRLSSRRTKLPLEAKAAVVLTQAERVEGAPIAAGSQDFWSALIARLSARLEKDVGRSALVSLLAAAALFAAGSLMRLSRRVGRPRQHVPPAPVTAAKTSTTRESETALFAPRFVAEWRDRSLELCTILTSLDGDTMQERVARWFQADKEALYWALVNAHPTMREILVRYAAPEALMQFEAFSRAQAKVGSRPEQRALARFLIVISREVARLTQCEQAPLLIQWLSPQDWHELATQLSRSRRRLISQRLGSRRSAYLQLKNESMIELVSGSQAPESEPVVLQKLRDLLESKASAMRDCIGEDREALARLDSFFADLTLDATVNADLALVFLASIEMKRRSFSAQALAGSPRLTEALQNLDAEVAALALYDCDMKGQMRVLADLGAQREPVRANLQVLLHDKQHSKKWKMRSRSLQRFLERQVTIADLFVAL